MAGTTPLRIIYIGGYGRSGSTVLGIAMDASPALHHLGEVKNLVKIGNTRNYACSCGKDCSDCPEWADAAAISTTAPFAATKAVEGFLKRPFFLLPAKTKETYATYWREVFSTFANASGGVAIDGSKNAHPTVRRAYALAKFLPARVDYIHVVRDPRDVMLSKLKGDNNKLARGEDGQETGAGLIGLSGWMISNVYGLITDYKLGRKHSHILRYEDFAADPAGALEELGRFLDVDFSQAIAKITQGGDFTTGHIVAGNRMSQDAKITIRNETPDRSRLKTHHKLLYWIFAWPLDRLIERARQARKTR